jgi:prepilin-type N-terminal cleavage/methylation domain-containing protein
MRASRRTCRGFTLIEIMMVIAIIGMLATIAIPSFGRFVLRSKTTERRMVMNVIKRSAEDFYIQHGRVQDAQGNPRQFLYGGPNPPGPPTPAKRNFAPTLGDWDVLLTPNNTGFEGNLYYSYTFWLFDFPGSQWLYIFVEGDLDGDRATSQKWAYWLREDGVYRTHPEWGWIWPPDGSEDETTF